MCWYIVYYIKFIYRGLSLSGAYHRASHSSTHDTVGRRANRSYPLDLRNQPVVVEPEPELTVAYGQILVCKGILRFKTREENHL